MASQNGTQTQMIRVSINGKFLMAQTEGMPRVAANITRAIDTLLSEDAGLAGRFDVELLAPKGAPPLAGLTRIRFRTAGRFRGQPWEQFDFPRHSRGRIGVNFTSTGPLLKWNCLTVIHDAQMFSTPESFERKHLAMYRLITPCVGRLHRSIVTPSEFARGELATHGICRDVRAVIPNAADHMLAVESRDEILRRLGLTPGRYIFSGGYLHKHKNAAILFRALPLLESAGVPLVLFGNSSAAAFEARGTAVPPDVVFAGRITDGEMRTLIEHAGVFAFPSTTEGFGIPPLEAMILGCPTVVARAGAMPEVCGDGAQYADPFDAPAWAKAFDELLSSETRRQDLIVRGRERAARFSWRKSAESYLDVLLRHAQTAP